ncbi:MAG: TlpA family protein disulfide reductase [Proteobacteria bacterium]|nr:TlpA family protein disulfide reductase [Pseudomonadota bacterium]MBU1641462.1 TlpA family protein disulfide reductase [Pseudomonadota bacterium]
MSTSQGKVLVRVGAFCLFIQLSFSGVPMLLAAEKNMPVFSLPGLGASEAMVRSDDFNGKVVLVNFWATWCPPCRREIPSLVRLQEENSDKGFTVIGISMDKSASDKVSQFVEKMGVNYPMALGSNEVARSFGALGTIPSTFLVDASGMIVKKYPGYTTYEKMAEDVKDLLK